MRLPIALVLALAAPALAGGVRAAAQDSLARVPGVAAVRHCNYWLSDGIVILSADSRLLGPAGDAYLSRLALVIARRFTYELTDSTPLVAAFGARVLKSGAVSDVRLVRGSERAGFDMEGQRAATIPPTARPIEPMPPGVPDSLSILISFGRRRDGSAFVVSHVACPATPLPANPPPKYPAKVTFSRATRSVRTRFTVDSTGKVDGASVAVDEPVSDAFVDAAALYVAILRYLPAEFDGRREAQLVSKTVVFVPPTGEEPPEP